MSKVSAGLILKGCPFCGRTPQVKAVVRFGMEDAERYGVVCYDCAICIGWEDSEVKAIERWNRRSSDEEREMVMPIRKVAHAQGADDVWYECSECGGFLGIGRKEKLTCQGCGRTVKWG